MGSWKYPRKSTQQQQVQVQKSATKQPQLPPPSWTVVKGIFSCRDLHTQPQQQQQQLQKEKEDEKKKQKKKKHQEESSSSKKMRCSVSLCSNNSTTTNTTKVVSANSPNLNDLINNHHKAGAGGPISNSRRERGSSAVAVASNSSSMVSSANSFRGMPFSRFSGCYECRMVVDPVLGGFNKVPSSLRSPTIWSCPDCPRIFVNPQSLELHQAVSHAVSELGAEDTSKNIVEIIFQSSWVRKEAAGGGGVSPVCKIDRILKVHNTQSRISKFEEYRDSIKAKATNFPKKHPRCIADGNELLRFHSATFRCSLGLNGSSNLCCSEGGSDGCNVCSIIRDGFGGGGGEEKGILTTATSGRAHEEKVAAAAEGEEGKRAMLVCRVIAGRVMKKKIGVGPIEELLYDSMAGDNVGLYSNLDELYVFNPMAILPCFVVIYGGF